MSAKTWFASRHARKLGMETGLASGRKPFPGLMEVTTATRLGSRPGGCRSIKALTRLNIVAFTAMPRARVRTATAGKPGGFGGLRELRGENRMPRGGHTADRISARS